MNGNKLKLNGGQYDEREFLLCDECCKKLGIPSMKEVNCSSGEVQDNKNTAQKLYDIIAEIVEENRE